MAKTMRCIEVRSANGKLMFSLHVFDEFVAGGDGAKPSSGQTTQGSDSKARDNNGQQDANAITEAQKRYLFRILADQGIEGDQALAKLKERLGVQTLNDATKREASALIEELLSASTAK